MQRSNLCASMATLLLAIACNTNDEADGGSDETPRTVTYWQDVAPIYFERCVSCHSDGGIAPFSLDNYEDAKTWAAPSAAAVETRTMPPWLAVADGTCGTFRDARALTDEEIATIVEWADTEMESGEARRDLEPPAPGQLAGAVAMTTPDFLPEIEGGPLAKFDEYRCFVLEPGLDAPAFITGYDVQPGNPAIVHHVLVATIDPSFVTSTGETNEAVMARLDGESPDRLGWPCYGGAGEGVEMTGLPVSWAPGQGVVEYPRGVGMAIGADDVLVAQVHYNLADPDVQGTSDSTAVLLRLEDTVERPGFMALPDGFLETLFAGDPDVLEPGLPSVEYSWEVPVSAYGVGAMDLHGVTPHMHGYGRKIRLSVERGGEATCAVDVPRWDFDWQLVYFYDQPLRLEPDDVLRVTCEFDTSAATEPITPGWGTGSEMCLMGLFASPAES